MIESNAKRETRNQATGRRFQDAETRGKIEDGRGEREVTGCRLQGAGCNKEGRGEMEAKTAAGDKVQGSSTNGKTEAGRGTFSQRMILSI
jgi:hypothetical protein